MKKLAIAFAVIVSALNLAHANSGLEGAMKDMKRSFKAIKRQAGDASMNSASAALAEKLVQASTEARTHIPDLIARLPLRDQPAQKARYEQMMDSLIEAGRRLAAAFRSNDNAQARELVRKLDQLEEDGHNEFKD